MTELIYNPAIPFGIYQGVKYLITSYKASYDANIDSFVYKVNFKILYGGKWVSFSHHYESRTTIFIKEVVEDAIDWGLGK